MSALTERFRREVFDRYVELLKAEYRFHPNFAYAQRAWEEQLTFERLVKGPYLEKAQVYKDGGAVDSLPLGQPTKEALRSRLAGKNLWKHQTDAIGMLLDGKNTVIATGTSSGKTLCYQVPILDDLVRDGAPGLRAIIVYPLNALVNDQLADWERLLKGFPSIKFARFTGQTPATQTDYEKALKERYGKRMAGEGLTAAERQRRVNDALRKELASGPAGRLNHRDDIRKTPPHILITNFSMLEYLLERPIDAPIFHGARLKFLVLDEIHAYRGVQATEIAFLVRRLKDFLGQEHITCIATSATLGTPGSVLAEEKSRQFASSLFGEEFAEPNPIYGALEDPTLLQPAVSPAPGQYLEAASALRAGATTEVLSVLGFNGKAENVGQAMDRDENVHRLRKEILKGPTLLADAAKKLWPQVPGAEAEQGLDALLQIIGAVKADGVHGDVLPTRLHYFVRSQDGLHVCLRLDCPGRGGGSPAFFVSRKSVPTVPEGQCPECAKEGRRSMLVEVVSCRKCGYLFGALQDVGPWRAQNPDAAENGYTGGALRASFDSFSTELGWAADSFWSYLCVDDDLPFPVAADPDEGPEDAADLLARPAELQWCAQCGKKRDAGAGDNCACENPHLRTIRIFHRQCPFTGRARDLDNLYRPDKTLLKRCPNCGAENTSGLEPLHRFQESDDAMGLAMAIPLAHFEVTARGGPERVGRGSHKLLCFTDNRQRAAAFPSLLEEETFAHDFGRRLVKLVREKKRVGVCEAGLALAADADPSADAYDPTAFLPTSRLPDEKLEQAERKKLWVAEVFSYFTIPDAARESAEDLGMVRVEYELSEAVSGALAHALDPEVRTDVPEAWELVQVLLAYLRQSKAVTLPPGVPVDAYAFGRVTAEIKWALRRPGVGDARGWLPRGGRTTVITDYLQRAFALSVDASLAVAERLWTLLTERAVLVESRRRGGWQLDHERLFLATAERRFACNRCGIVTAYSVRGCCPRKDCRGKLEPKAAPADGFIARWIGGEVGFSGLRSEEHTAQISRDLAAEIEDQFKSGGVDLISSTTTFEMGINIGDLQKLLLRNAPPSSANYVQRIGRAGRGRDKNAVCVTMCRRGKYDADMWNDPPRLMSGQVRPPTVFLGNPIIAQRHFNALAFGAFLRQKVLNEQVLGEPAQRTSLEALLPEDCLASLPDGWRKFKGVKPLDFAEWLGGKQRVEIAHTGAAGDILYGLGGFEPARGKAMEGFRRIVAALAGEIMGLMGERKRLHDEGKPTGEADGAVKNALGADAIGVLAKRGFLPRYAFPLDVVTLETGLSRWSRDSDVELARERGIAISEFAPGAQVIAHKKIFTSAGLYIVGGQDKPVMERYSLCPDCGQIRVPNDPERLLGPCAVCHRQITRQFVKPFVTPAAFSVRVGEPGLYFRRSSLVRQRQGIVHFIDQVNDADFAGVGKFRIALREAGTLFRYNRGPEGKGFFLCPCCGFSEPFRRHKAGRAHDRLRGVGRCDGGWPKAIEYGHVFQTFCLVIRPPIGLERPESLAYALQRGLCGALDIEASDIGVSWRWLAKSGSVDGAEIVLYDQAPGGAGFVREARDNFPQVVQHAMAVCKNCSCERACYDCLKSYGNQTFHERLDRISVLPFLA